MYTHLKFEVVDADLVITSVLKFHTAVKDSKQLHVASKHGYRRKAPDTVVK